MFQSNISALKNNLQETLLLSGGYIGGTDSSFQLTTS